MQLEKALVGAVATARENARAPQSVTEAVALFGGGRRGASGLASALSGSTDKSSKEYKSALRNVERYMKGEAGQGGQARKPSAKTLEKLAGIGKQAAEQSVSRQMRVQGATISLQGDVLVESGGKHPDERARSINSVYLYPDQMAAILDKLDAKDVAGAADIFNHDLLSNYGFSDTAVRHGHAVITDVEELDMQAGENAGVVSPLIFDF